MMKPDSTLPLISCIMPTMGKRKRFVAQAIRLFDRQDYPNKELLIVDEHDAYGNNAAYVPSWIRYVWLQADTHLTIGAKRNLACSLAQGDILCQWDDDDYYGPHRLSKQAEPLLRDDADCSAMRMSLLLDATLGKLWTCSDATHRLCFKQDVQYGTLMFNASYWRNGVHFASVDVGEDVRFVHALLAQGARLARIVDPTCFIYVLHGGNTTSDMRDVHPEGWEQIPMEQYFHGETLAFYQGLKKESVCE